MEHIWTLLLSKLSFITVVRKTSGARSVHQMTTRWLVTRASRPPLRIMNNMSTVQYVQLETPIRDFQQTSVVRYNVHKLLLTWGWNYAKQIRFLTDRWWIVCFGIYGVTMFQQLLFILPVCPCFFQSFGVIEVILGENYGENVTKNKSIQKRQIMSNSSQDDGIILVYSSLFSDQFLMNFFILLIWV